MGSRAQRQLRCSRILPVEASGLSAASPGPRGRHTVSSLSPSASEWRGCSSHVWTDPSILHRTGGVWAECELWPGRRSVLQQHQVPQLVGHLTNPIDVHRSIGELTFHPVSCRTFLAGVGSPPMDSISPLIISMMAVGLGVPLLFVLLGSVYICVRKRAATTVYQPIN